MWPFANRSVYELISSSRAVLGLVRHLQLTFLTVVRLIWIPGTTRDFSWSRPGNPLQSPGESRWYFWGNFALLEARIHHSRIAQASIRLVITEKTQMVCVPSLCVFSSFFENLSAKNSTPLLGIELSDPSNTRANYPEATGSGRRPCNFTTGFDHHARFQT